MLNEIVRKMARSWRLSDHGHLGNPGYRLCPSLDSSTIKAVNVSDVRRRGRGRLVTGRSPGFPGFLTVLIAFLAV